jgi:hypothetical protein
MIYVFKKNQKQNHICFWNHGCPKIGTPNLKKLKIYDKNINY